MGRRTKKGYRRTIKKGKWTKSHGAPTRKDMERLLWAAQQTDRRVQYDPT